MRTDGRVVPARLALTLFVTAIVVAGAGVIAHSISAIRPSSFNAYALALAALTIVSTRFAIKVPGRPATVSVSEVFIFVSILLFGPAVPVLTAAIDGLWVSLTQRDRRLYRMLFNVAEPAISTWAAAQVFFAVARVAPGSFLATSTPMIVVATVAMAATFFMSNSGLSAIAVALETGKSAFEFWRSHALYLAVNDYAGASIAALAVSGGSRINFGAAGLVAPLLLLSYIAYREASSRVDDAQHHIDDLERLYKASVEMLAIAVDAKDQVTHGHIRRVQRYTLAVAKGLGVTDPLEVKAIEAGALLHDIGKVAVPDYVLNKPSTLTAAEFQVMKKHATMGARILTAVDFPYPIVPIVRHHHERWDGRGYPDGLTGSEIPLGARILAVVDCFDALTSDRPYRPRLTDEQAIEIVRSRQGTFYDPAVVEKFIALIPELRRDDAASHKASNEPTSVAAGLARGPQDALLAADEPPPSGVLALPSDVAAFIDERIAALGRVDASLFTFNASLDVLVTACATPRIRASLARVRMAVGDGVSGWVAANRSSIRRADPVLDLGDLAHAFSMRWCASVPVFVGAELFGVLTMYVSDASLTEDSVDALGLLAQEVGLSIAHGHGGAMHPWLRFTSDTPMTAVS
jgi:putative nucleotidyltransferase with HDIG domain